MTAYRAKRAASQATAEAQNLRSPGRPGPGVPAALTPGLSACVHALACVYLSACTHRQAAMSSNFLPSRYDESESSMRWTAVGDVGRRVNLGYRVGHGRQRYYLMVFSSKVKNGCYALASVLS